jgi:uncharacterized membrane protein (UPF0127 family)
MQEVLIYNQDRPQIVAIRAKYCQSFLCQLRGLTFRRYLPIEDGLLLVQKRDSRVDSSIHMLFVWMDLAVIWINQAYQVVDARLARRWRPVYVPGDPARFVLEIAAERIADFQIGDRVEFREVPDGKTSH